MVYRVSLIGLDFQMELETLHFSCSCLNQFHFAVRYFNNFAVVWWKNMLTEFDAMPTTGIIIIDVRMKNKMPQNCVKCFWNGQ